MLLKANLERFPLGVTLNQNCELASVKVRGTLFIGVGKEAKPIFPKGPHSFHQ